MVTTSTSCRLLFDAILVTLAAEGCSVHTHATSCCKNCMTLLLCPLLLCDTYSTMILTSLGQRLLCVHVDLLLIRNPTPIQLLILRCFANQTLPPPSFTPPRPRLLPPPPPPPAPRSPSAQALCRLLRPLGDVHTLFCRSCRE